MIKGIIISGFCFVIGNIVWPFFDEPKIFYVPLAVHLFMITANTIKHKPLSGMQKLFIKYFVLLAAGNFIKQLFYTEQIKQVNDYIWGALVTIWLLYNIKKNYKWQTHNKQSGKR